MDPGWLSNAYLVADERGGTAVFVDSGPPMEHLLETARDWNVEPRHVLRTHAHPDHVAHEGELGAEVVTGSIDVGGLRVEVLATPGHSDDHLAFLVNGELCFSGDILFKDAVGGGVDVQAIRHSVMEVLMKLPPETRVLPGHTDETTIGREWEENPFVRYWRGVDSADESPCLVGSAAATILVVSPDYDGKGKLLVRFENGREAIVGGSRVTKR
jgi:glyoxylase-like metal-dependent hydrolase (beta-lactamase superfamily II)